MAYSEALEHAIAVIKSYESSIKDSKWTGVDLVAKGFCQGAVFTGALDLIQRLQDDEDREKLDNQVVTVINTGEGVNMRMPRFAVPERLIPYIVEDDP